jgi:hypothetical protein
MIGAEAVHAASGAATRAWGPDVTPVGGSLSGKAHRQSTGKFNLPGGPGGGAAGPH